MTNQYDIASLFKQAFGINPPPNYVIEKKQTGLPDSFNPGGFSIPEKREELTRANLGSPLYGKDKYGRQYYMPVTLGGVSLWLPVIGITLKKTIVETGMVERRGTVKEIINKDDIEINIKGLIVNPYGEFPQDELTELNDLFCRDESLELRSAITDIFFEDKTNPIADTYKVVIRSVPVPMITGTKHVKPYEIVCVSDTVFELELK